MINMGCLPTMGSTIPRQVGQGYIRKLDKYELESKPSSSLPLWFLLQIPGPSSLVDRDLGVKQTFSFSFFHCFWS